MHRRSDGIYSCTFNDDYDDGLPTSANIKFCDDGSFSFMTFTAVFDDEDSEARTRRKVRFSQLHWFNDMELFYTDHGRYDSDFVSPTRLMRLRFVMDNDASYLRGEGWLNKDGSMTVEHGYVADAAGTPHVYTFSAVNKRRPE